MSLQKDNSSLRFAAIILCGGKSSRMGRPKADLPFGEETMLQRLVRRVFCVVDHVTVVAARDQAVPDFGLDVTLVRDSLAYAGPLAGLGVGLDCLRSLPDNYTAAYVTSCDVPFLKPEFVQLLFSKLGEYDVVVPVDEQFHHPLAAVYRTTVAATVVELVNEGERRPRALFERVRTLRVPTKSLEHVDPQLESLLNLNTPAEYQAALIKHGSAVPNWLTKLIDNTDET